VTAVYTARIADTIALTKSKVDTLVGVVAGLVLIPIAGAAGIANIK